MKLKDYIEGDRRGKHARRLELEAMRDPLLHDALEGFDAVEGDHGEAIDRLRARVTAESEGRRVMPRRRIARRWSVAAAAAVLCAAMGGLYLTMQDRDLYADVVRPDDLIPRGVDIPVPRLTGSTAERVAIGQLSQTQLDSLVALRSFEYFAEDNMAITTDDSGQRVSGRTVAEFTADAAGRPRNIRIIESPAPEASREAVRLIRNAPEWPDGMTLRVEVEF